MLVKDRLDRSLPGTRAGHLAFGAGGWLTRHAKEMSRDHDDARHAAPARRATAAGRRQLAGRSGPVACLVYRNGRRPAGARAPAPDRRVLITEPIQDSTARLIARAGAVSTGSPVLDRLLAGPDM